MRTTRRSLLALGLVGGVGALSACSGSGGEPSGGGPADRSQPDAREEQDADAALVDQVVAGLDARLAALAAAGAAFPTLLPTLAPLDALHRAHRAVLDPGRAAAPSTVPSTVPSAAPSTGAGRTAVAALRRVRTGEEEHRAALAAAATTARSGALARVLAAAQAGLAQHLALLPTRPAAPGSTP